MSQISVAQSKIKEWRENPLKFIWDVFGVEPDHWQRDALEVCGGQLTPRRRLSMKACTGPGKSAVLAWIGWHRLACFASQGEHPKGIALSGEGRANLRDNLWAELAKWQQRSEFLKNAFVHNNSHIHAYHHPETWFLSARSYAKDANVEAIGTSLSGLHSKYPFILLDETGDMPAVVGQKAGQIFTGSVVDGLIASAGNPTSTTGLLYHVATVERELWTNITITADPDDPKRTPRVDVEHARQMIKLHGRDNPWVMATILGLFPKQGLNTLLSLEEVEAAINRTCKEEDYEFAQKRLGIDAARFGDDFWVIFPRQGIRAFKPVEMRNPRSYEVAARVAKAKEKWGSEMEFFDGTGGYAAGAVDSMIQAGHSPQEISFSGKATDPRYYNKRSEMWFEMAEWVKKRGCLPNVQSLIKELTAPKFYYQDGKFRLEEKDQIKKRLGFSPNNGDALALTFAMAEMPGSHNVPGGQAQHGVGKTTTEFDPYRD